MAVTYTTATERALRRAPAPRQRLTRADVAFAATSCIAVIAIALAYLGRMATVDDGEQTRARIVNLNTVADAAPLEAPMGAIFAADADRRFAAQHLFDYVADQRRQGRELPNVGAIARVTVEAAAIDHAGTLDALARRLHPAGPPSQPASTPTRSAGSGSRQGAAIERAENSAAQVAAGPHTIALFTAADRTAIKPFLVVRTRQEFRRQVFVYSVLYVLAFAVAAIVWRLRGVRHDLALLAAAHLITAIGFAALVSRPDPLRDSLLFVRFAEGTAIGLMVMTAVSFVDLTAAAAVKLSYLPLVGALSLSALLILFGSGPGSSGARVNLGPLQPIEAIRLLLALFLAGYFARRWELLRALRTPLAAAAPWRRHVNLPRAEYALPVLGGVGLALVFFFLQKDLGPALILCCVFLAVYAVARARVGMAVAGFMVLTLGFYAGYHLHVSRTLADRVRMWESPWDNGVAGGDQLAHAVWGAASGGPFGAGLGLGDTRYLPAGHTDLILAAVGEELGAAGLIIVAAAYALLAWRGLRIARLARTEYGFFLATVLTLFLIVPALIMGAGVFGITPLTGVVTPFLSYGGSAMAANFCALGMLAAIYADRRPASHLAAFRVPSRWLASTLAAAALLVVAVAVNTQVVHGDDNIARPHLGTQADGGRRFEYNPRVLDVARQLPRGTIYDRRGLPLATDDPAAIAKARAGYAKMSIAVAEACATAGERCYPLGGAAFHVIGDARSRVNWSAPNSSYVERDAENHLRGFDDHAETVSTIDSAGRPMLTIRRDYRELVAAVRHRREPENDAFVQLRRPHDVSVTIDAGLQQRVAAVVASYATRAAGKAAAVVIDPDTGEVLASASYPWPELAPRSASSAPPPAAAPDALLDRARYGLYPPGSTFKLVTAAAALRQHLDPHATTFTCARLPDGRVGAKIEGWHRPVRDDVLDERPHGTIDEHDGFVHSCNAYFAQLAVKLGSRPLAEAAERLGISLSPGRDAAARVRDTLPQIGYGQGDVLATPLRMARAAAAVASSGQLRETHWLRTDQEPAPAERFLDPEAARLLAGYMRDVVVSGTGKTLRNHPARIAGKTGTAEVDGQPSHSWFVGYAPFGPATKRVAFAVIVENAGYGAASAAPAAGEIVTAATLAGYVK